MLHVHIHFHLGEFGVEHRGGMHEGFHDEVGVAFFDFFHLQRVVVVHLHHAHAGVDERIGDADHLIAPQGHAGKLPPFPQGDIAKLEFLGQRHLRADFF